MDENKIKFEFIFKKKKKKKSTQWRVKAWKYEKKRPWQKRGDLLEPPRGQVGASCSFSLRLPMKTVSYRFEGFSWKYTFASWTAMSCRKWVLEFVRWL